MRRRVRPASRRGLLLVEAVLSAVVIAVGLVFISRALASPLKALRTVEEYDTLLMLAPTQLLEWEAKRSTPAVLQGAFQKPYEDYRWTLKATPRDGPNDLKAQNGTPLTSTVTFTVQRGDRPGSAVRLQAVWPSEWIPQ